MAHTLICVNMCNSLSLDILCLDQFVMFSVTSPHLIAEDRTLMYMYEAELIFNNLKVTKKIN